MGRDSDYAGKLTARAELGGIRLYDCVETIRIDNTACCLHNSITNDQVFLSTELLEELHVNPDGCDKTLVDSLKTRGFVPNEGENASALRERTILDQKQRKPKDNLTLLRILLTDYCNLDCDYCKVVQNIKTPTIAAVSEEKLKEALELFFLHSDELEPKIVHCTGGEPLVHWNRMLHLFNELEATRRPNENYSLVIGTNATLVTEERAKALAAANAKCIVSMDGWMEIHDSLRKNHSGRGTWSQVDKGLQLLRQFGVEYSISTVVGKHNIDRIDEIIDYLITRYQPSGLGVNFLKPPTVTQKDYPYLISPTQYAETIYNQHRKWRNRGVFFELPFRKLAPFVYQYYRFHDCGAAAGTTLNLDSRGNYGPCKSFLLMEKSEGCTSFNTHLMTSTRDSFFSRSPIFASECRHCPAQGICGNGCAYEAWVEKGDPLTIDSRSCTYTKVFFKLMLRDLYDICGGADAIRERKWHIPSQEERLALLGQVRERPGTLSYSIGHHSKA